MANSIIDLSSSDSPPPMTRTRQRSAKPNKKPPSTRQTTTTQFDIIEITDSEDEPAPVDLPRVLNKGKGKEVAVEGDILRKVVGEDYMNINAFMFGRPRPNLLADHPRHAQAGPSSPASKAAVNGAAKEPLFMPSDDDQDRVPTPGIQAVAASVPSEPLDTEKQWVDSCLARVLEIIPDIQPAYALSRVEGYAVTKPVNVVELVLHSLFEDPTYPKIDKNGKRKRIEEDVGGAARGLPKHKVDYGVKAREHKGGPHYFEIALDQLMTDFPLIPKPYIRMQLLDHNGFYAPTYIFLAEEKKNDRLPYVQKSIPSRVTGKGKARRDPELENEREWLRLKLVDDVNNDATVAEQLDDEEYDESGDGIECGCCFSSYAFDKMFQCPDAHLFCKSCMTSYASNLLGEHNPKIACMDQSGCKLLFPYSELQRFLTPKLMELYERVKQRKDIEAAGLENLEECPFCEYKVVIENEQERLFHCENADCGAVSCRECKKLDHLPKSCKEMDEDKHLDAQHTVEEAMTNALMRKCPKCQKAFIKENGCNKMTCPNCHTVSCYVCRQIIHGYEHFGNPPPYNNKNVDKQKCSLWDPVEQRHADEVKQAAQRAIEELKRDRPDMDQNAIKVDIPLVPPPHVQPRTGGLALAQAAHLPRFQLQPFLPGMMQPLHVPVHFQVQAQAEAHALALARAEAQAQALAHALAQVPQRNPPRRHNHQRAARAIPPPPAVPPPRKHRKRAR